MTDEFEKFAQQIGRGSADSPFNNRIQQCPHCKEILSDAYLEQNPFSEVPCSSCGSLVTIKRHDAESPYPDQRVESRCPVSLKVSYRTYNEFIDEYTRNVSRQGMFIRTIRQHSIHELAELLLHVPDLPHPVRIKGEIVHIKRHAPHAENCGIGVKFIDIDDQSREALISFIRSRENGE
ncbi:MAG: PilZ domain-containing protein [Nitrospirae bacterium]|nr:PilZ domain-containing protein [Nitrospirota bacterium]